ncbi:hypothetical protein ABID21_000093 [Pseudorhizobium tarimense]|uniref:Uncharacterized protein n=1 Tax=Pseudorhizobium tarimense TaxID=1079109 RepID=A0ABV2H0E6_9HYPH|nr:hypothetical protein [Pseudorhizobium tarimense]MCJ8517345.1 hypothetical protein [Pseudorhizobium tarimense]
MVAADGAQRFKDASEGQGAASASDTGSQGSLAAILFSSNRDEDQVEETSLSRLIASLKAQAAANEQPAEVAGAGAVEDI